MTDNSLYFPWHSLFKCLNVFGLQHVQQLLEQVGRIELPLSAWKAEVLPLNYTCLFDNFIKILCKEPPLGIEPKFLLYKSNVLAVELQRQKKTRELF